MKNENYRTVNSFNPAADGSVTMDGIHYPLAKFLDAAMYLTEAVPEELLSLYPSADLVLSPMSPGEDTGPFIINVVSGLPELIN